MNLMVLDKEFHIIGPLPVFNTLIWTRRYHEVGMYELHTSAKYFPLLNQGKYLYRNDREELGLIQELNFYEDVTGRSAYCKGNFAEALLNERVIESTVSMLGTPEEIAIELMNLICIQPEEENRVIPNLTLKGAKGIGIATSMQTTGKVLGEKLYSIEATQDQSHRIVYDYLANEMKFEVWEGLDRTDSQSVNSWAVFSDTFANVKDVSYNRNDSNYKNVAYVYGEGEGTEREWVFLDIRSDPEEERRELYVDARDLQKDTGETVYSDEEYEELLQQRGLEKLTEYKKVERVSSNIDPLANLKYRVDFDLGDLCTYVNTEIGITLDERITEIQEIYEKSKTSLTVTFGTDETMSVITLIKKETS